MNFNNWASKYNDFHWFFNVSSKNNKKPSKFKSIQSNPKKFNKAIEKLNIPMMFNNWAV